MMTIKQIPKFLLAFLITPLRVIKAWLFKHGNRLDCRCCSEKLDEPGGNGIWMLGMGFCNTCTIKILIKKLRG
jgi:hypothetical protein